MGPSTHLRHQITGSLRKPIFFDSPKPLGGLVGRPSSTGYLALPTTAECTQPSRWGSRAALDSVTLTRNLAKQPTRREADMDRLSYSMHLYQLLAGGPSLSSFAVAPIWAVGMDLEISTEAKKGVVSPPNPRATNHYPGLIGETWKPCSHGIYKYGLSAASPSSPSSLAPWGLPTMYPWADLRHTDGCYGNFPQFSELSQPLSGGRQHWRPQFHTR